MFTAHPHWLPTRGDDSRRAAATEHPIQKFGAAPEDVLAVVENEQHRSVGEMVCD
jgi:hypothetical protein